MALVLARFGFGFCMLLAALMLLVAATLLATRLVGWAVRAFALERSQALASGVAIFLLVALALWGCHAVGEILYGAIGATALVGGAPHWLAGNSHVSAAALMGATTAAAMLAGGPAFWRWLRARRAAAAEQPAPRKAAPPKGRSRPPAPPRPLPRRRSPRAASAFPGWAGRLSSCCSSARPCWRSPISSRPSKPALGVNCQ
ncbi:hypothetical protein GSJ00_10015 [Bordetella pertussis]|uniref:hypothetical protein n=1 Tax=Bordetella pertussis TaxID=520 RepID=UPI001F045E9C|nr:hypothetical protein [Bordetella pertussis]WAZ38180.1 hypothetical protein FT165_09535 [Bordetella pertussis]